MPLPPQRAEWMPGSPPSALTSSPESSASAGRPEARAAATAFSARILGEAVAGLLGLRQPELACGHRLDAVRREQIGDLAHLAFIVAGDDEARAPPQRDAHQATVSFCSCDELGDAALRASAIS